MPKSSSIELIARGLTICQNKVLLCRNIKHGYHFLPGGHIEFGESARIALQRELIEECSLKTTVGPLLLTTEQVFQVKGKIHHEINLVFHMEQLATNDSSPADIASNESKIAFDWIDLAAITGIDLRPAEIKAWLASDGGVHPQSGPMITGIEC